VETLHDSSQLRDTAKIANRNGKKYVVFTRASTAKKLAESGRSGLYKRALKGKVAIIGCLPG
jgi:hypothetical protein